MPRLVRIGERTPLILQTTSGEVKICRCGLSKKGIYCDGSEALTEGEDPQLTYEYDAKGKRKVLDAAHDEAKPLSKAWKWVLPVAYVLIPANVIATLTGYLKLPAKYVMKGQLPGVSDELLEKTPYGFLFPILLQLLCVVGLTWLSMHPQYANPQKLLELADTKIGKSAKDRFNLWVRRLIALVALVVSAFFTYISTAVIYSAVFGEDAISLPVVLGFAAVVGVIIAGWVYMVRRHFRTILPAAAPAPAGPIPPNTPAPNTAAPAGDPPPPTNPPQGTV